MINELEKYLCLQGGFSENDLHRVSSLAVEKKLSRNEFLLRNGEVCRHKIFIVKGLLRTFGMTQDGNEHILKFSPENTWTLEKESYDQQTPARVNISAVEPSEVLLWTKPDFERLIEELPPLKWYTEKLTAQNIYSGSQRLLTTLSATPEEKYENFIQTYPQLLLRLPLKMIAAYLGISLRTLDRIRHAQL